MKFQTRTFLVLLTLIVLVEGATFYAVLNTTRNNFLEQGQRELSLGSIVFGSAVDNRGRELALAVGVLAGDFGFKGAAASRDEPTIRSALINHGSRISADIAVLVDREGRILASSQSLQQLSAGDRFPFSDLLRSGPAREKLPNGIVSVDDLAMQMVVAPVRAPDMIGWVAVGFAIDNALAQQINLLTNLDVSFLKTVDQQQHIIASTLPRNEQRKLLSSPPAERSETQPVTVSAGGDEWLTARNNLASSATYDIDVVLGLPLYRVLEAYGALRTKLIAVMIIALALSGLGARVLSRTVSKPLQHLAAAARRISRGDYCDKVDIVSDDELGTLASAFNNMQQDIQRREDHIVFQSQHDALTGLPNRTMIGDRLEQSVRRAQRDGRPFAVLMIDLNGFKDINDSLGHATGDHVLIQVARRLLEICRDCDTVARLGGDEFLILLEESDLAGAVATAERLLERFSETLDVQSMQIRTFISIGIASFPDHGVAAEEILRRADIAMYTAKGSDKHIAVYQSGQDEVHLRRLALVNDLRLALENEELLLYYQPKMDLRSGRVTAVEALVRWPHATHGMISPEEFVPLAEQSGYIRSLTHFVLEKALSQIQRWRSEGIEINVSINLSALDLLDNHLPDIVAELLARYSLAGDVLTLEITESAVMKDTAYARGVMERLRHHGIKLSIDDFGTGHASLAQLKRLPVDELKIDKSFVTDLAENKDDAAIVRSTIELGHNMGLSVTAEGVETDQSRSLLLEYRCDVIQGFLLSKPLPEADFVKWIRMQGVPDVATGDVDRTTDVSVPRRVHVV